jgi:hypothetical protein
MSVGVPLMEIVFAVHVAVTPSGKPIAVPIPVAPVVAWVIVVSVELTHKEGLEEALPTVDVDEELMVLEIMEVQPLLSVTVT